MEVYATAIKIVKPSFFQRTRRQLLLIRSSLSPQKSCTCVGIRFFFLSLGEETTQACTVENISKMVMHVQLRYFLNFFWMFLNPHWFLTAILHRGLRNDFFFSFSNLLFPIFIWTFISLFYLDQISFKFVSNLFQILLNLF